MYIREICVNSVNRQPSAEICQKSTPLPLCGVVISPFTY